MFPGVGGKEVRGSALGLLPWLGDWPSVRQEDPKMVGESLGHNLCRPSARGLLRGVVLALGAASRLWRELQRDFVLQAATYRGERELCNLNFVCQASAETLDSHQKCLIERKPAGKGYFVCF